MNIIRWRFTAWIIVILAGAAACKSLETRLQETAEQRGIVAAYWLSINELRENPDEPEYEVFVLDYGARALDSIYGAADLLARDDEFAQMYALLYDSPNSARRIITAAEQRGLRLGRSDELDARRSSIESAIDGYHAEGRQLFEAGSFQEALDHFSKMRGLRDANDYIRKCNNELHYAEGRRLYRTGSYRSAYNEFNKVESGFRDVNTLRAEALERGKVVVAVGMIDGAEDNTFFNELFKLLMNDIFIDVVNLRNVERVQVLNADVIKRHSISYLITGSIAYDLIPYGKEEKGREKLWYVTNEFKSVAAKGGKQRFVRVAEPTKFTKIRESLQFVTTVQLEVVNVHNLKNLVFEELQGSANDSVYYYEAARAKSTARLTLKDPSKDTIRKVSKKLPAWRPSSSDKRFHKYFNARRKLKTRDDLQREAAQLVAGKCAARAIEAIFAVK